MEDVVGEVRGVDGAVVALLHRPAHAVDQQPDEALTLLGGLVDDRVVSVEFEAVVLGLDDVPVEVPAQELDSSLAVELELLSASVGVARGEVGGEPEGEAVIAHRLQRSVYDIRGVRGG